MAKKINPNQIIQISAEAQQASKKINEMLEPVRKTIKSLQDNKPFQSIQSFFNPDFFQGLNELVEKHKKQKLSYLEQKESMKDFMSANGYISPANLEEFFKWFEFVKHDGLNLTAYVTQRIEKSDFIEFHEYELKKLPLKTQLRFIFKGEYEYNVCLDVLEDMGITYNGKCELEKVVSNLVGTIEAMRELKMFVIEYDRLRLLRYFNDHLGTAFATYDIRTTGSKEAKKLALECLNHRYSKK